MPLYIFATVFGVGVTLVDLFGLLGGDDAEGGASGDDGDDGAGGASHAPLLSVLRYLRTFVYFCLGFGPFGLVAGKMGNGATPTLVWALGGGAVVAVMARAFFRFQNTVIDSSVGDDDVLFEQASVTVPLSDTDMGRVRIHLGQAVVERYALASEPNTFFATDDVVQIVSIADDCVYVAGTTTTVFDGPPSHLM